MGLFYAAKFQTAVFFLVGYMKVKKQNPWFCEKKQK